VAERWANPVPQAMQRHTGFRFATPKAAPAARRDSEDAPKTEPRDPAPLQPCQAEPGTED
jgi:hypothetical protein